jgi:hypothetical protein
MSRHFLFFSDAKNKEKPDSLGSSNPPLALLISRAFFLHLHLAFTRKKARPSSQGIFSF